MRAKQTQYCGYDQATTISDDVAGAVAAVAAVAAAALLYFAITLHDVHYIP